MVRTPAGKRRMLYNAEIPKKDLARAAAWAEREGMAASGRLDRAGDDWTVGELRLAYLTWCLQRVERGETKQHTFDGHRKQLNLVCRAPAGRGTVADVRARDFGPRALESLVERWEQEGKSPTTIRNRCASLMAMFTWASTPRRDREVERLIPAHPIAGYELPKAAYQGDRYAPAAEVAAFLAFVDLQAARATGKVARFERLTALLIRVVAETGCRPGELCAAQWPHFDPAGRTLTLPPELHKTGHRTQRNRVIVLSPVLAERVAAEQARPDRHPTHVFVHRIGSRETARDAGAQGIPWNSNALSKRIRALRTEAIAAGVLTADEGLQRMHLYRLRHSFGTNAVQAGVPLSTVAALMGNSARVIETTYLHPQADHLRAAADTIREREGKPDQS